MEKSTLYKVLLTIGVVVGGGGFLIYSSVGHAQHYRMVDELVSDGGQIRLAGPWVISFVAP